MPVQNDVFRKLAKSLMAGFYDVRNSHHIMLSNDFEHGSISIFLVTGIMIS